MPNGTYENLRMRNKPDKVDVLFVGESRPQGGTFFYQEDSALYRETKRAFNEYFAEDIFTLENFKQWHCWLYDICDEPVNGMPTTERRACIRANMPQLVEQVKRDKPKLIIVCKKGLVKSEVIRTNIMEAYRDEGNIFFLPFPAFSNQRKYREGLVRALKSIDLEGR